MRAGRIDLDGTNLETGWWGPEPDAAPTLVLLHEGLGSVGLWRGFPAALAEATGCGVFAWSRPGYGASTVVPPPRPLTYMHEEAAARVGPVLDAAGIRRCVLLGHSDGGSIAVLYAGTHADPRVRGLALLAPHVVIEDASIAGIAMARERYLAGDLRARLARHHRDVDATFRGWNGAWLDPGFRTWDITREAAGIGVPTLVVQGLADPYGTERQVALVGQAIGPLLEPVLLPGIGHAPHLEAPEATLAALLPFLRRVLPPLHRADAAL